jgi:hypothetical protein
MLMTNWGSTLADGERRPLAGQEGIIMITVMQWASVFFYLWVMLIPTIHPTRLVELAVCKLGTCLIDLHAPSGMFTLFQKDPEDQPPIINEVSVN